MIRWAIEEKLAGGPRPRGPHQRLGQVRKKDVDEWIELAREEFGVRSIICLLDNNELLRYGGLPVDLLSYYRRQGLKVIHVPAANHRRPRLSRRNLAKIWKAYNRLPKPILVHCSAGISRTTAALTFIKQRQTSKTA